MSEWPKCVIGGCQNGAFLRGESPYCHPHTMLRLIYLSPHHEASAFVMSELDGTFEDVDSTTVSDL